MPAPAVRRLALALPLLLAAPAALAYDNCDSMKDQTVRARCIDSVYGNHNTPSPRRDLYYYEQQAREAQRRRDEAEAARQQQWRQPPPETPEQAEARLRREAEEAVLRAEEARRAAEARRRRDQEQDASNALIVRAQGRHGEGKAAEAAGNLALAKELDEEALEMMHRAGAADSEFAAPVLRSLGEVELKLGNADVAERRLGRSLELTIRRFGFGHYLTVQGQQLLAAAYLARGRLDDAEAMLKQTRQALKPEGKYAPGLADTCFLQGQLYQRRGKAGKAESYLEDALEIREHNLGPRHRDVISVRLALRDLYRQQGEEKAAARQDALIRAALGAP